MGCRHGHKLLLRDDDLRAKLLARKARLVVIFVVDASGSMALNRMQAAKGAVLQLLAQAYRSRDQIALIVFRGGAGRGAAAPHPLDHRRQPAAGAAPLRRRIPLAHGLSLALRLGENARHRRMWGRW